MCCRENSDEFVPLAEPLGGGERAESGRNRQSRLDKYGLVQESQKLRGTSAVKKYMRTIVPLMWDGKKSFLLCSKNPFSLRPFHIVDYPSFQAISFCVSLLYDIDQVRKVQYMHLRFMKFGERLVVFFLFVFDRRCPIRCSCLSSPASH